MKPILIRTDSPEVRRIVKIIHPMIMENPVVDEEGNQLMALSFHIWNYQNLTIDPMTIINT